MRKITAVGKSIEEAIQTGLTQLGVTEDQVKIDIIEQPSKGLFGLIGSKEAKVEMEIIVDPIREAYKFLEDILGAMNLSVEIEKQSEKDQVVFSMTGPELGIIIGRRGQTLDSLQYLVNIVANRFSETHLRIVLDAENFRKRRKQTLENLAERLVQRVLRSKDEIVLEPMSPMDRKVIHAYLQEHPRVMTFSRGEEPNRRVVIALK